MAVRSRAGVPAALIAAFRAEHAAAACAEPAGAYANCYAMSLRFAAWLRARDVPCSVLHLRGSRSPFPDAAGRWPPCAPERFEHWVVEAGGLAIDWTARQFVPDAPLPLVLDRAELGRRWREISSWLCVACDPGRAEPAHADLALGDLHLVHREIAVRTAGAGPFADPRHPPASVLAPLCGCAADSGRGAAPAPRPSAHRLPSGCAA
ncbi:MAG: hypothetical protein ACXVFT_06175 [Solirubrobacteraceae bacterium]